MAQHTKTSLARFKSANEEFQLSWNPKTDRDTRYPIIDQSDEELASYVQSLGTSD